MEKEWDEVEELKVKHNVHEETTQELAEMELKAEERKFLRDYENRNNN